MAQPAIEWSLDRPPFRFHWNLRADVAVLSMDGKTVWTGGLLPLFEVAGRGGKVVGVPAVVDAAASELGADRVVVALEYKRLGKAQLVVRAMEFGLEFESLTLKWAADPVPLMALHFGAKLLRKDQSDIVADLSKPYWPSWVADGYCVPSFKGGPCQSFFRRWEPGNATMPLGSFGPSMGTPYAAAFPRPVFGAGMGNGQGWMVVGCGEVPEGAMLLQVRASSAHLEYRYREDLWGAPIGPSRVWGSPLRLTWAGKAWDAFDRLFATFPVPERETPPSPPTWNTWADFRQGRFDLRGVADAAVATGNSALCIDDFWETFSSSGKPDLNRFPKFHEDLGYAKGLGLSVGFWQSSGWLADPAAAGLGDDDLVLGADGRPRRSNWALNPNESGPQKFCLDPSSPRTISFLQTRTRDLVRELGAKSLKIDFAYGLPSPDVGAPRDPKLRGERYGLALLQTIAHAAREKDPGIAIQNFGIHPLLRSFATVISLDDLGDAGGADGRYEIEAHAMWSVWAALLGRHGTAINASGGYHPDATNEVLLNTTVIGAPGVMVSADTFDGSELGRARTARWKAVCAWFRRTTRWRPLWLDSESGTLGAEPSLSCWGRLEPHEGGEILTSVALRPSSLRSAPPAQIAATAWAGRWSLVAQDDAAVIDSGKLAVIPFDFTSSSIDLTLAHTPARVTAVYAGGESIETRKPVDNRITLTPVPADAERLMGYLIER